MQITPANVGDVICREQTANFIRIEAVSDEFVHFRCENGDQYATYDHDIAGGIVRDEARLREFAYNASVGTALQRAERSALNKYLNRGASAEERKEAAVVLKQVREMQDRINRRIADRSAPEKGRKPDHGSLDAMISKAAAEAQGKLRNDISEHASRSDR